MAIYRDQVPEHLKTTGQLLTLGKRPSDPTTPVAWLEAEFRGDMWRTELFAVGTALPIPPTTIPPADIAHSQPSARQDAARWAHAVLHDQNAVVVDTELTDFHGRLIEVAVVATDGTVLLDSLVNPEGTPINPRAQQVHGITEAMLVDAPTMAQLWDRLDAVLHGKTIIAWNASFDQAKLDAERERLSTGGDSVPAGWLQLRWKCAMREHAIWVGQRNDAGSGYRNHKLHGGHRARGDCSAVLQRLREMATSLSEPTRATSVPQAGAQDHQLDAIVDAAAVRRRWQEILEATKSRSQITAAILTNAIVSEVDGPNLVLSHPSAPLARRLSEPRNSSVVQEAAQVVLGGTWTVRWQTSTAPQPADRDDRHAPPSGGMSIVKWTKTQKAHVSKDGVVTACGSTIPPHATVVTTTTDWHEHTNCYNCAKRLWPDHAPAGFLEPADGNDFPLRRRCPHGGYDHRGCTTCSAPDVPPHPLGSAADVHAVLALWPQLLEAVRQRSRATESMLRVVRVHAVRDRVVVLRAAPGPLARRLAEARNQEVLSGAAAEVFGPGWTVQWDRANGETEDDMDPVTTAAVPPDAVIEGPQGTHAWQDSFDGQELESWVEINPGALCEAVAVPGDVDSAAGRLDAFYSVNHTARCPPEGACRTILRLAEYGRFVEATELAERLVLSG